MNTMEQIERHVVAALRRELDNPKLRHNDLIEFSSGPVEAQARGIAVEVEAYGMTWNCVVTAAADGRARMTIEHANARRRTHAASRAKGESSLRAPSGA